MKIALSLGPVDSSCDEAIWLDEIDGQRTTTLLSIPLPKDLAAEIVKRVNLHDELVEALGKATRLVLDVAEQQAMPDDSWKPAWDECIAVIRKARGKA